MEVTTIEHEPDDLEISSDAYERMIGDLVNSPTSESRPDHNGHVIKHCFEYTPSAFTFVVRWWVCNSKSVIISSHTEPIEPWLDRLRAFEPDDSPGLEFSTLVITEDMLALLSVIRSRNGN